jgi:SAM-dependent methyltransferase
MGTAVVQGRLWGAAARDWADNEVMERPFYEAVFRGASVGPGTRLLDLGCGAGEALAMAIELGATAVGIDASEGLLTVARARASRATFHAGELEELPFDDDTFDVVTSFNAVQFAADPVVALREARRVTRPGGLVGVVVWGTEEQCETRAVLYALGRLLPPPPTGADGPFALSEQGRLEQLVSAAGLSPVSTGDVTTPLVWADLADALRVQTSSGPARLAIEVAGEERVRAALTEAFASARQPDGTYRHDNVFRYIMATA